MTGDLLPRLERQITRMRSARHRDEVALGLLVECAQRLAQLDGREPASDIARDRDMVAQAQAGQLL